MLIGIFKSNQRTINLLVILMIILLWIPSFFDNTERLIESQSIFKTISGIKWLNISLSIFIVSIQAIYLNYLVNLFKLVKKDTYLVALLFVVLNGATLFTTTTSPILIVNGLSLLILHQLLLIYNLKQAYALSFNISLLIGITFLIYPPTILLLLLLWITLSYTKTVLWREFVISLLGLSLPITYMVVYYFISEQLDHLNYSIFTPNYFINNFEKWTLLNWSYFITLTTITIIGIFTFIISINKHVVKIRKHLLLVLIMLALSFLTILINNSDYFSSYLLASIPLSIVLGNLFNEIKKKWLSELLFLCIIGTIIMGYFS